MGTRYSPPSTHPVYPTPGTPLPRTSAATAHGGAPAEYKVVVGLKSVRQLSLSVRFSRFQGITEGYNLRITGRINNHLLIPGTE